MPFIDLVEKTNENEWYSAKLYFKKVYVTKKDLDICIHAVANSSPWVEILYMVVQQLTQSARPKI